MNFFRAEDHKKIHELAESLNRVVKYEFQRFERLDVRSAGILHNFRPLCTLVISRN